MLKPSGQRLRRVTLLDGCVCKQVGAPKPQRAWTELRDLAVAETPSHPGFNAHFFLTMGYGYVLRFFLLNPYLEE